MLQRIVRYCRVLQCDALCCSVLQCVAVRYSASQCIAMCCSVLQCVIASIRNRGYGEATISRLLKSTGSFAKELYKRDDILQKRPIILRHLLMVATPYLIRLVDLHGACIKHSCGTKSLFGLQKPDEIIQFPINDRSAHTQRNKERLEQYGKKECAKPTNSP